MPKGHVLDAVQWGFVYDTNKGILPRPGYTNKTLISPAPTQSIDTDEAIANYDQHYISYDGDQVIPFH